MDNKILLKLYKSYKNEIYLYLYSLCGDKSLAEDLTQETFMKAILSLSDEHSNMRAWLYMVARNLYFNHRKRENRSLPLDEIKDTFHQESSHDIFERLIRDERKRLLFQALQHLGELKREILTMQYFGQLSQKEIAALLKLTPENVRVLAYRGKKELKSYLEENGYEVS